MNILKNALNRFVHKLPKHMKCVWYNQTVWIHDAKYPIVYDDDKKYIPCKIGLIVVVGKTKNDKNIFYKVKKMTYSEGYDLCYSSDAINCDLKFSHIDK